MKTKMFFTILVLTVVLSFFLRVHPTQGAPTMSASASAGGWSASASATPGISDVNTYERGAGYTGTGTAHADVMGDTNSTINQSISATCDEYTIGYQDESGIYFEYTVKFVSSTSASESNYGMPYSDKWASANGSCGGAYDDDYASYDSSWW